MDRSPRLRQLVPVAVVVGSLLVLLVIAALGARTPDGAALGPGVEITRPPVDPTAPTGGSTPSTSPSGLPAPPSTAREEATLIAGGDIAVCGTEGDEATAALLDGLGGTIVTLGDTVYPRATRRTFERCFDPSWGRHRDRIRPVPGNHDWDAGDLDAYLDYFGDAAVNEAGDPWYAFELGSWQVIALVSDCDRVEGCGPESAQGRWLAETLADSDARCTVAAMHHPRFSSGQHGPSEAVIPLWEQLHDAGVEVVLSGHDHDYERFGPQDPDGDEDRAGGIRQFVVGTGGVDLRAFDQVAPNSELRASTAHGLLEMTLRDGAYSWVFHAVDDAFEDRGTAVCR